MKKILCYLAAMALLFVACREYDDSELVGRVDNLEERVTKLETWCSQMNSNISALQTIVAALQQNDNITSIMPITEAGDTIGYTIAFVKNDPIAIYHGKDGADGQNGKDGADGKDGIDGKDGADGYTPVIGVCYDDDEAFYWTLDGEWLLDENGNKIKAVGTDGKDGVDGTNGTDGKDGVDGTNGTDGKDGKDGVDGITPQLKIEDNFWYVSYDNGATWVQLGKASGEDGIPGEKGDAFFLNVSVDGEFVTFYLQEGVVLTIPLVSDGAILNFKFLAQNNPLHLSRDIECSIDENGVIRGHIPNIVNSKLLIPVFDYQGIRVFNDTIEIVSGETLVDFSRSVNLSVEGKNGARKNYIVELMAFTGLPVVYINTEGGASITSKEEYINATIKIVEDVHTRSAGDVFEDSVRIKGRGNSTWGLPKKPYKLKFNKKQSLLGEPKDKEWILLANYTDKTSIRNALGLYMGKLSDLDYTCRTHFVDLILNHRYVGTYQLGEQQKISKNRVNVGDDGYLLEVDAKASSEDVTFNVPHIGKPINIKDPNIEIGTEAYNYVVAYMNRVDSVLFSENFTDSIAGYAAYIDVSSFVEWYLVNEISKNNDACYWTSCYMNLSRGGKLKMGPLWDFDIAFGNVNYNNNYNPTGFWIKNQVSWYKRLFKDTKFVAQVKERFNFFYQQKDLLFNEVNENAEYLRYSVLENNAVWGTLYEYTWPNYAIWGSYDNEVAYLKQWLDIRLEWLKEQFDAM